MDLFSIARSTAFCLALSVQVASAAGGGGGGGLAPGGSSGGPDLNELFREGVELLDDGECERAEKKFRTILRSVSRNPEANFLRGAALQCQGEHKTATRYLKKAVRYDPELYAAYQRLGVAYLALGKRDDAQSQLDRLDELRHECGEDCPQTLARAHRTLSAAIAGPEGGDIDSATDSRDGDAEKDGDQHGLLFDSVDEPQTTYLTAVELIHSDRFEQAIDELRRLTAEIGPHPDVLNYLGYAHRQLGRFERARDYYEQALAIDPMHRGANEYLGEMWVELGRIDRARMRLFILEQACPFGCAEYEDLKRVIESRVVAAH